MIARTVRFQHISVHVETAQRFAQARREAEARDGRDWTCSDFLERLLDAHAALGTEGATPWPPPRTPAF